MTYISDYALQAVRNVIRRRNILTRVNVCLRATQAVQLIPMITDCRCIRLDSFSHHNVKYSVRIVWNYFRADTVRPLYDSITFWMGDMLSVDLDRLCHRSWG
jgi:hypothetical protein